MALLSSSLYFLRQNDRLLKLPPYLSFLFILIGVGWLLLLPLNDYSRQTYVSENALLPGQVHTYFDKSEHNVFRAYRHEVSALVDKSPEERTDKLFELLKASGLKVATQDYSYVSVGRNITGNNVYALLRGPRADATEAIVLIGAWRTMANEVNQSGVALVLTLARYFKRWSLWSKDIIFVIPSDPLAGSEAWVSAYHDAHDAARVQPLPLKSGALQGAIAVEYPAGPWGHRFDKLHVMYNGVNGQLANLDLFNTFVSIASGQMGIGCTIQRMWKHDDSYEERLTTILRGMLDQGLGHASGPHSSFIPYHVDALTVQTVGDGWHDEMSLGRTVESMFRSLNNLLEHLHQSFFFYLLMHANRFVSIGTYLPAAMIIAASFSITAVALWVQSGRPTPTTNVASTMAREKKEPEKMMVIQDGGKVALVPESALEVVERHLFLPIAFVCGAHFLGLVPLYLFTHIPQSSFQSAFIGFSTLSLVLPISTAITLRSFQRPTRQETQLIQCLSLLLLGLFLSALATLNFSLSFLIGLLSSPLSFIRPHLHPAIKAPLAVLLILLSPVTVIAVGCALMQASSGTGLSLQGLGEVGKSLASLGWSRWSKGLGMVLREAADGWNVQGVWTPLVVWCVWWPAWFTGAVVLGLGGDN